MATCGLFLSTAFIFANPFGEGEVSGTLYFFAAVLVIGAGAIAASTLVQRVEITGEMLTIRWGLVTKKLIPLRMIQGAYPADAPSGLFVKNSGWDIVHKKTFGEPVTFYNHSGTSGVMVETSDEGRLFIGTPRPEELAEAIRRVNGKLGA